MMIPSRFLFILAFLLLSSSSSSYSLPPNRPHYPPFFFTLPWQTINPFIQIFPTALATCPTRRYRSGCCDMSLLSMMDNYGGFGDSSYGQAFASDLLYKEQEKLIVERGEFEELLFTKKATTLLAPPAIKVRGIGKAGGFGNKISTSSSSRSKVGGSSGSSRNSSYNAEGKIYAQILIEEGLVRIDNVLSAQVATDYRQYLYELRNQSEQEVKKGIVRPIQRFANVLLKHNRCDLTIPLGRDNEIVTTALLESIVQSPIGSTIASIFGKDAILHEFSCLMSDPGSQRQVIHSDTPYVDGNGAVLYTIFIALQDIRLDMGPTTWLPRTHNKEMHDAFKDTTVKDDVGCSPKDHLIKSQPAVLGILPRGSCVIFDSRILHCGTANRSSDSRALFYFSFKNPMVMGYTGNPASIRKELADAKVTLGSLIDDLVLFRKGEGSPLIDRLGRQMT